MKAEDPDHHPTPVVSCENCVRSIPASSLETKDREVGALLSELRCFCMYVYSVRPGSVSGTQL